AMLNSTVLFLLFLHFCLGGILDEIYESHEYVVGIGDIESITSFTEIADVAVDDLWREFPDIVGETLREFHGLKKDLNFYYVSPDDMKEEIMAGFPSEHKYLQDALKKLRVITKERSALLNDEYEFVAEDTGITDIYLMYYLQIRPLVKVVKKNKASYKKRNVSEEEIKNEI
ncbi:hypothetical protein PFISCL1PPCAC_19020, partial [Pristionchus fissidentatus]